MQSLFLNTEKGHEKRLRGAQIPFEPFKIGRQEGVVFDDAYLTQVLGALHSTVERQEKSPYEGVQILHIKRNRNGATKAASAAPATVTAEIKVEKWARFSSIEQREAILGVVREFSTRFGVREISILDNDERGSPRAPCLQEGKLVINFWCAPTDEIQHNPSANKLWGYKISEGLGHWNIWKSSGQGTDIRDNDGTVVAEVVGSSIYVLYPITDKRVEYLAEIFRRILEEALTLWGPPEMRVERQRQYAEKLLAEVRANPVIVKKWSTSSSLREKFVAVATDFAQAFGGKQIFIYDYCGDGEKHRPADDGRVHVCIWSSSDNLDFDGDMQTTLFGAPLQRDDRGSVLKPSGDTGVLLTDEDGNQVGKMMGDTIYIHYPLTERYINLKWDGKGPEALFRRILEEVVFQKTATEKQKAARARAIAEKYRAQSREQYVKACNGRFERTVAESKKVIEQSPQKVREYQQAIVQLIRGSKEAEKRIEQMEGSRAEAVTAYAREFDELLKIPKIRDVRVSDGVIKVFTDTLYCVDPRTKVRHEIGAFRIELCLDGTVLWFNLDRKVEGYHSGMNAPHVYESGKACLGNMSEVIPQLVADYEFAALAMVCIQFVESVNVDDAGGKYINKWPVAA